MRSTTGWCRITRPAHSALNRRTAAPIRVPPDQSGTASFTLAMAASVRLSANWRVTRVSAVENTKTSTRRAPPEMACANRSSIRVYGSIEPLTSHISTSGRGATRRTL